MISKKHKKLIDAFGCLGRSGVQKKAPYQFVSCKNWENIIMSPVFATGKLTNISLNKHPQKTGAFRVEPKSIFRKKPPYLVLLKSSTHYKNNLKLLKENSWKVTGNINFMYWEKKVQFELPKNYTFEIGDLDGAKPFCDQFWSSTSENFPAIGRNFRKDFEIMIKSYRGKSKAVLIKNTLGRVVSSGAVLFDLHSGFICVGSVHKSYRGKGLWNCLLGIRQLISSAEGVHVWISSSINGRIKNKGDFVIPAIWYSSKL